MGYPKKTHVVFCPKKQRSSEPFMRLDLEVSQFIRSVWKLCFTVHDSSSGQFGNCASLFMTVHQVSLETVLHCS